MAHHTGRRCTASPSIRISPILVLPLNSVTSSRSWRRRSTSFTRSRIRFAEILAAEQEHFDKVWYIRHLIHLAKESAGQVEAPPLDYVTEHGGVITEAVSSQPWSGDAVVHVSIVNWIKDGAPGQRVLWLNNTDLRLELDHIPASLRPGVDVGRAAALPGNQRPKECFQGQTPGVTRGFTLDAAGRDALSTDTPAQLGTSIRSSAERSFSTT